MPVILDLSTMGASFDANDFGIHLACLSRDFVVSQRIPVTRPARFQFSTTLPVINPVTKRAARIHDAAAIPRHLDRNLIQHSAPAPHFDIQVLGVLAARLTNTKFVLESLAPTASISGGNDL